MNYLRLDYVDLLSLARHQQPPVAGLVPEEKRLPGRRPPLAKAGPRPVPRLLHPRHDRRHPGDRQSGEFDYVNLHWYFVNTSTGRPSRPRAQHDMGVFIISPNDKGGKLYEPPPKLVELCAPLTPMQFNDLYCLARPEVHTLSCGAARPGDFDEHVRALDHYDNRRHHRARSNAACAPKWSACWAGTGATLGAGAARLRGCAGPDQRLEILRLWTYAKSLDLVAWGKMRYNLLGQADHWFPGGERGAILMRISCGRPWPKVRSRDGIPAILAEAHTMLFDKPKNALEPE